MDYEKKYKEALERAKKLGTSEMPLDPKRNFAEQIFPELEKNKDEKIRKALIENFKFCCGDFPETSKWGKDDDLLISDIIAWLENQGEQKPTWNSEDEKIAKELIRYLPYCNDIAKDTKERWIAWLEKQGEKTNPYSGMSFEYNGHTWGMCARDYGVDISLDGQLFKHLGEQGDDDSMYPEEISKLISMSIALSLINYLNNNRYEGAMDLSSMECEDLEKAILASDWGKVYRYMRKKLEKQDGQKSSWSEEDKLNHKQAIYVCHQNGYTAVENWLKSLKPQNKWKPTEEQLSSLKQAISYFGGELPKELQSLYNDLQKLLKE